MAGAVIALGALQDNTPHSLSVLSTSPGSHPASHAVSTLAASPVSASACDPVHSSTSQLTLPPSTVELPSVVTVVHSPSPPHTSSPSLPTLQTPSPPAPTTKCKSDVPPQRHLTLGSAASQAVGDSNLLIFGGSFYGFPANFLIDSGASASFVDVDFMRRCGLTAVSKLSSDSVLLADGTELSSDGFLPSARVRLQGYSDSLPLHVMSLHGFSCILGMDWLSRLNPHINWEQQSLTFTHKGRTHTLSKPTPTSSKGHPLLLSRMQLKRAIKARCQTFLFGVRMLEDDLGEQPDSPNEQQSPTANSMFDVSPLLEEFSDVFSATLPANCFADKPVQHEVPTLPGAAPPNRAPYRMSPSERTEVERQVKELLDNGFLRPSSSSYGAPILLVRKKSGEFRFVLDYRGLNNITVKQSYPMPTVQTLLDQLSGATCFTSVDMVQGFLQLPMHPDSIHKTAFRLPSGESYEWLAMPFGLTGAPATFQRFMNTVLRPYLGRFLVCFLDDCLCFSRTPEEHAVHLRLLLELLRKHKIYAKFSKCRFAQPQTEFLGHIVSGAGIAISPRLLQGILDHPPPTCVRGVQRFLGMVNYHRRQVQNFARLAAPLYDLLQGKRVWCWGEKHDKAFLALKAALSSAPVMAAPDFSKPFIVRTDASDIAVGAVLLQGTGESERVVAYESRKLKDAESRYEVHDRELLSVVHALRVWRPYLLGAQFSVSIETDNTPTVSILSKKDLTPRQIRWSEFLAQYDFTIRHIPGVTNVTADCLSRMYSHSLRLCVIHRAKSVDALQAPAASVSAAPRLSTSLTLASLNLRVCSTTLSLTPRQSALLDAVKESGLCDPDYTRVLENTKASRGAQYIIRDGVLFRKTVSPDQQHTHTLYIPSGALRTQMLSESHDTPTSGHFGRDKTLARLRASFYWPGMDGDVREYVRTCPECQRNKASNQKPFGLLQSHSIPARPWGTMSMDLSTDLPVTTSGFDTIVVFVCMLTRMIHAIPTTKTVTAQGMAQLYIQHVFKLHGIPDKIVSDRDPRFTADFWACFHNALGTSLNMSTANHPQTDGSSERALRTIKEVLRARVSSSQDDWDIHLPLTEFAYNSAINASTGYTPFFLNYGYTPSNPLDLLTSGLSERSITDRDAHSLAQQMATHLASARDNIAAAQARSAAQYNKHHRAGSFKVGDQVMLSVKHFSNLPHMAENARRTLSAQFYGPYAVTKVVCPVAYRLDLPGSMRVHDVFHISRLLPYHDGSHSFPERAAARAPPPPDIVDGEEHFHVTAFRGARGKPSSRSYLVQFTGFGSDHMEWISAKQLQQDLSPDAYSNLVAEFTAWQASNQQATSKAKAASKRKPRGGRGR